MCTAVTYTSKDHYFGRTFDWDVSYGEKLVFVPRNFRLEFRKAGSIENHLAMLGIAVEAEGYPLYYDAINEAGLGMAGLNFPDNTEYKECAEDKDNIAPFEFIPWILGQCRSVKEAKMLLGKIQLVNISFNEHFQVSPLHWIIADKEQAITVECVKDGLKVYDNPVGVLTNNPPFDVQMLWLSNYMQLSNKEPVNALKHKVELKPYSRGMGAMGLPGDLSSASRFVKAAFTKLNGVSPEQEEESVSQFFHILGSVEQQRGCVLLPGGEYEISVYTSCCNLDKGIYYYKTYDNSEVWCVDMHRENMDGSVLKSYELKRRQEFKRHN